MTTKILTPAPPVAEYIQWTGGNFDEVRAFVEIQNANLDVSGDGQLLLWAGTSGQRALPLGAWLAKHFDDTMPLWIADSDLGRYREVPVAQSYTYDITGS